MYSYVSGIEAFIKLHKGHLNLSTTVSAQLVRLTKLKEHIHHGCVGQSSESYPRQDRVGWHIVLSGHSHDWYTI